MLSKELTKALSDQMVFELYSAYIYLAMAAKVDKLKFPGGSSWLKKQAGEEIGHADRFYQYLLDQDAVIEFGPIAKPAVKGTRLIDIFKEALKHEQVVSARIDKLYEQALKEKSYATVVFLNWFVTEQVEEEKSVRDILDRLTIAGDSCDGTVTVDEELGSRTGE